MSKIRSSGASDPIEPGFTVMGYPAKKVEKDGSHRKAKAKPLSKGYSSRAAAEEFAKLAREGGAEVTGVVEWGRPIH